MRLLNYTRSGSVQEPVKVLEKVTACVEAGRPKDYRFLDVNPAFEQMTGLKASGLAGRTLSCQHES